MMTQTMRVTKAINSLRHLLAEEVATSVISQ